MKGFAGVCVLGAALMLGACQGDGATNAAVAGGLADAAMFRGIGGGRSGLLAGAAVASGGAAMVASQSTMAQNQAPPPAPQAGQAQAPSGRGAAGDGNAGATKPAKTTRGKPTADCPTGTWYSNGKYMGCEP